MGEPVDRRGRWIVPLRIVTIDGTLSFITATTHFSMVMDVTLSEIAIEAFLPADAQTAAFLRRPTRHEAGAASKTRSDPLQRGEGLQPGRGEGVLLDPALRQRIRGDLRHAPRAVDQAQDRAAPAAAAPPAWRSPSTGDDQRAVRADRLDEVLRRHFARRPARRPVRTGRRGAAPRRRARNRRCACHVAGQRLGQRGARHRVERRGAGAQLRVGQLAARVVAQRLDQAVDRAARRLAAARRGPGPS